MLTMLDLFAGIGGATVAADKLHIKTTQFVEIDPDAQRILKHHYPHIPIHADIRTYHPQPKQFDIIWNSFPCTGTSIAGRRQGLSHPESALWRESIRCFLEVRPKFFVIEQPDGVIGRGLRAILAAIRMVGYSFESEIITAAELGAGHRRPRLFIISYPDSLQRLYQQTRWADQVRTMVQTERVNSTWLTVKHSGDGDAHGVSAHVVRGSQTTLLTKDDYSEPTRTYGRLRSRFLAGRSVTPPQAAIALRRVLYLSHLTENQIP
jgi:DNA (cytosine-5)-methyltransferase 1